MSAFKYNYGRAFALYSQGHPLEEVAEICDMPTDKLKEHASREGWGALVLSVQSHYKARQEIMTRLPPEKQKMTLERLQANREANFAHADMLRQVAYKTLEHWISIVSQPNEEGQTGIIDPKALKEMAAALAQIHELTYRALGDAEAKTTAGPDRAASSPQITINLPGVLVNPRGARQIDVSGQNTTTGSNDR